MQHRNTFIVCSTAISHEVRREDPIPADNIQQINLLLLLLLTHCKIKTETNIINYNEKSKLAMF